MRGGPIISLSFTSDRLLLMRADRCLKLNLNRLNNFDVSAMFMFSIHFEAFSSLLRLAQTIHKKLKPVNGFRS